MFNARDAMKQITFKRTVYPNKCNRTPGGDHEITIINTEEEVVKEALRTRTEERQTSPNRKVRKHIM